MQGIKTTKYGPHRIKASCQAKTIVVDRDSTLDERGQHRKAAMELANMLGWIGWWYCAWVPGVKGMVWASDHKETDHSFYIPRTDPSKESPR